MLCLFQDYIAQQHLFSTGEEVLLAVSGGRDSVVMTDLMQQSGIPFAIAHCNFHLRGAESDRDQQFVKALAAKRHVPFHTIDFDTLSIAAGQHMGIEEAARHLRYDWFQRLCEDHGYTCVATAHHRDDSVETLLLNLFRGTGIHGLHGIRPKSRYGTCTIVRPMLCFSRADIDRYVAERGLAYVDDSTNAETLVRRNQLRLEVLPFLRRYYPSIDTTLQADIERFAAAEELYNQNIADLRAQFVTREPSCLSTCNIEFITIHIEQLIQALPDTCGTVLFELLRPYGFGADTASAILDGPRRTGGIYRSPSHEAVVDRGRIVVVPIDRIMPTLVLESKPVSICNADLKMLVSERSILVDADQLHQPLLLRPWKEGDRFCPFGMKGSRLVSDFLKDSKLNLFEKQQVLLAVDADDRVVWVVGLRADNRFRITEATSNALMIHC